MSQQSKRYRVQLTFYCDDPNNVEINTKEDNVHITYNVELNEEKDPIPN